MLNSIQGILGWMWSFFPWSRWKVAYVEDAPDAPHNGRVFIVGGREHPFQAVLACPCRCGCPIWLDLVPGRGHHWTAKADSKGVVTLAPSVWRTDGCRSHFVLRRGRVEWC